MGTGDSAARGHGRRAQELAMMNFDRVLLEWTAIWLVAAAYVLYRHWKTDEGVGLVLTYVLTFGMLHWVAPVLYLLPWYDSSWRDLTREGSKLTALAMV